MDEYPAYFPPFMRDFHDQKNLCKAFWTWLEMMDNKRDAEEARRIQCRRDDRAVV